MTSIAPKNKCKTKEFADKMRRIAVERGYKPPSQKGLKRRKPVWNKGKKSEFSNEKHPQWKGEDASYGTVHSWVRRQKGRPEQCTICGAKKTHAYSIQWANVDHRYRRDVNDYVAMCQKCHRAYDIENNGYTYGG